MKQTKTNTNWDDTPIKRNYIVSKTEDCTDAFFEKDAFITDWSIYAPDGKKETIKSNFANEFIVEW